jgi:hypothetical protein
MAKEYKTLTTRFDNETYAEFSAAVEILGFRTINSLVHQLVTGKIREAKKLLSDKEFAEIVERQKAGINKASRKKSKERLEMLGELAPKSRAKTPVIEIDVGKNDKKRSA